MLSAKITKHICNNILEISWTQTIIVSATIWINKVLGQGISDSVPSLHAIV